MNWKQLLLRALLLSWLTSPAGTACVRTPKCAPRAIPSFGSVVTSSFLLENLKLLTGISTLTAVRSVAETPAGYAFALPGSDKPDGESYLVTIDYSSRSLSTTYNSCSGIEVDATSGRSCLKDLRQLPFSAGGGGAYRGVKFTTIDAGYDVQVAVFEKLKDTTATRPLALDDVAALIAEKYCAVYRNAGERVGSTK